MRPVPRDLAALRLAAESAARDDDWSTLLGLVDRLRSEDPAWWPHLWAPLAAVASHDAGSPSARNDAVGYLGEAVDGGFRQPDMLPLETLHDLPQWPDLAAAMASAAPPPEIEVLRWSSVDHGPPLVLDRLRDEREDLLSERVPPARGGAWETARVLLEWATTSWEHANDHVDSADALEVLDRADAGERFACVEYSVLLCQSLNARGVPARRVDLRTRDQHVGFGRGHVVGEAWIDDLGRWVVLDAQNGAWWGTADEPLGLRELQELEHRGAARPPMSLTARGLSSDEQDGWWHYFHSASSSGLHWCDPLVPVFQGEPAAARLVVPPTAITHPDLAAIQTGVVDTGTDPGLLLTPVHPYATGVQVGDTTVGLDQPFDLGALATGEHDLPVRTLTPYGALAAQPLVVVRR